MVLLIDGYFVQIGRLRNGDSAELLTGTPKYQGLPAFLLGRLAVDSRHHGKGIGELLLSHCLEHCLAIGKCSGGRYLIADVKPEAVTWYERYNFAKLEGSNNPDSTKMFLDLHVARSATDHRAAAQHAN